MAKNKNFLYFFLAALLIIFSVKNIHAKPASYKKILIKINNFTFEADIADTENLRKQGLSGRKKLDENKGMFFTFESAGYHDFWMKGMNFPIDIIWIKNSQIVDIKSNIPPPAPFTPDTGLVSYHPVSEADSVLELAAGVSQKCGFKTGDAVFLKK